MNRGGACFPSFRGHVSAPGVKHRILAIASTCCFPLLAGACGSDSTSASPLPIEQDASVDASLSDGLVESTVDSEPDLDSEPEEASAGADTTVTPFDKTPIYFTGSDNKRTVDSQVSFPSAGTYEKITLHLTLACPSPGGCDPWDRFASLGVVTSKGQDGGPDTVIEIARFITPYHVGADWEIDMTELRPLLSGDVMLRAFIDTWVGPGSAYGDGWLLTASFEMKGGLPAAEPIAVIPVFPLTYVPYGDPAKPIPQSLPAATVSLPADTKSVLLRSFVTGHGQGNANNCAEFCSRDHTLTVGQSPHTQTIWRTDCATTAAPNQQGTYQYSRAGWCPGATVNPWSVDITSDVAGQASVEVEYSVQDYENTCRPDANPCTGCTLGSGCEYDGGSHTEPNYQVSAVLIAFR